MLGVHLYMASRTTFCKLFCTSHQHGHVSWGTISSDDLWVPIYLKVNNYGIAVEAIPAKDSLIY